MGRFWGALLVGLLGCGGQGTAGIGHDDDAGSVHSAEGGSDAAPADDAGGSPETSVFGVDGGACGLSDSTLPVGSDCVAFGGCGETCGRSVLFYCGTGTRPNAARCLDEPGAAIGSNASVSCCDAAAVRASSYDGSCGGSLPPHAYAMPVADPYVTPTTPMAPVPSGCVSTGGHARGPFVKSVIYCCP